MIRYKDFYLDKAVTVTPINWQENDVNKEDYAVCN